MTDAHTEGFAEGAGDAPLHDLGRSRPPLRTADIPTPEQSFRLSRVGPKELARYVLGPSIIALGAAVGSGEWLLGPLAAGQSGFRGIFFIILISVLLQAAFNYECARYTLATGEPTIAGWGRIPPGWLLWIPLALALLLFAHIFGGWASAAGESVFVVVTGEPVATAGERQASRFIAIGLIAAVLLIVAVARLISRAIELVSLTLVATILTGLLVADLLLASPSLWGEAIAGFFTPTLPGGGMSATQIGALAGYAGMTAGLNWFVLGHYRDKGYAMGHLTGFLTGGRGQPSTVERTGITFPESPRNAAIWRRWRRILRIEMWGIFAPFAVVGMLLPSVLMVHIVRTHGEEPTDETAPTFVADHLGAQYGPAIGALVALLGMFVFLTTLLVIFEGFARTIVDASAAANIPVLHRVVSRDARRVYFPVLILFAILIIVFIHLAVPTQLVEISGNLAAGCMIIFPPMLIFLNRKLPRPARMGVGGFLLLAANVVFFGTFFVNFVVQQLTGAELFVL